MPIDLLFFLIISGIVSLVSWIMIGYTLLEQRKEAKADASAPKDVKMDISPKQAPVNQGAVSAQLIPQFTGEST